MAGIQDVARVLKETREKVANLKVAHKQAEEAAKQADEDKADAPTLEALRAKVAETKEELSAAKQHVGRLVTTMCQVALCKQDEEPPAGQLTARARSRSRKARSRSRSKSRHFESAMKSFSKVMQKMGKKFRDDDSSTSEEEGGTATPRPSVRNLLSHYNLEDVPIEELPKGQVRKKLLKAAKKDVQSHRSPFIGDDLGQKFLAAKDLHTEWAKTLDKTGSSLTMSQFSALWRRSLMQLLAQSENGKQTLSLGDLVGRWLMLSRIGCQESVGAAVAYDKATWSEAEARIGARDCLFRAHSLADLNENKLAEILRTRNNNGSAHKGQGKGKEGKSSQGAQGQFRREEVPKREDVFRREELPKREDMFRRDGMFRREDWSRDHAGKGNGRPDGRPQWQNTGLGRSSRDEGQRADTRNDVGGGTGRPPLRLSAAPHARR